jgi:hypothetical protein
MWMITSSPWKDAKVAPYWWKNPLRCDLRRPGRWINKYIEWSKIICHQKIWKGRDNITEMSQI